MVEAGFLTEGQIQTARRNPATAVNRSRETTPDFYLDWAFGQVKELAAAGKFGSERVLVVKTPLDTAVQKKGEQALEDLLRQQGRQFDADQGAIVTIDVDGAVRAMVGGRDYGQSQFNRATDALRQPGSSFKPFVYAAAMSELPNKYRPASTVVDRPVCIGNWCPSNYARSFSGSMSLTSALARSINTIPVIMSQDLGGPERNAKIGRRKIIALTRKMGVKTALTDSTSLPIGSAEVTVLDMAAGYSAFANGGRGAEPYAAFEVRNGAGDLIYRRDKSEREPEQVLTPQVAADMNLMLSKVPEEGTGKRAALEGIRSAGKTGTTNAYRDAWYVGYTGNLVGAVWFGNDDHSVTNNMTGGSLPAMAWHQVMTLAHQNTELRPIPGVPPFGAAAPAVAKGKTPPAQTGAIAEVPRPASVPGSLSKRSFEVIGGLGELMRSAERGPAVTSSFAPPARAARTVGFDGVAPAAGGRLAMP
jgi:penicillin-binding protein 1A